MLRGVLEERKAHACHGTMTAACTMKLWLLVPLFASVHQASAAKVLVCCLLQALLCQVCSSWPKFCSN